MGKLSIKALGLSLGIIWGAMVLLMGLTSMIFNYCTSWVLLLSTVYIGYDSTILGSIVGAIWGFVDAGIGGILIAWLYNKFVK